MEFFFSLVIILSLIFLASLAIGAFVWWRFGTKYGQKQTVVDALARAAFIIDSQNKIQHVNTAATTLFSTDVSELIGENILSFVQGEWPQSIITQTGIGEFTAFLGNDTQHGYVAQISSLTFSRDPKGREFLVTLTPKKQESFDLSGTKLSAEVTEQFVSLATRTTREPELKQTAPAILSTLIDATEAENGSLLVFDERLKVVHGIAMGHGRSKVRVMDEQTAVQAGEQAVVQEVLANKQKFILSKVAQSEKWGHLHTERTPIQSLIVAPIIKQERILAVLMLTHAEENRFDGSNIQLLTTSNDLLSHVLHSSQKYEASVHQSVRQQTIDPVLKLVNHPTSLSKLAKEAVKAIAEQTGWVMVALLTPRIDEEHLTVTAVETRLHMQSNYDLPLDQSFSGQAYLSGQTQIVSEEMSGSGTIEQSPIASLVCIPLTHGDEKQGVLTIGSDDPDAFTKEDIHLAELVGEAISVAMANTVLHDQTNRHVANLNALFEATTRISRQRKMDDVLDEALQTTLRFTGFDAGLITLTDSVNGRLQMAHHVGLNQFAANLAAETNLATTISGSVQQHAKYLSLKTAVSPSPTRKEVEEEQPDAMQFLRDMGYVAYSGAPLLYQNKAIGTLCLFHSKEKALSAEEQSVHLALAQQTAVMVTSVRLADTTANGQKQFNAVVESSREGIIIVDPQWRVSVLNETAVSLLGLEEKSSKWVGRHLRDLARTMPTKTRAIIAQIRESIRNSEDNRNGQWQGTVSNDDTHLEWLSRPIQSRDMVSGRLFAIYDVSESHKTQQLREDLVYTMAHDLRNSIGIANMSAQYFRDRFYNEWEGDDREVLEGIEVALNKSLKLITGVLELSRLEDRSLQVQPSWVESEFLLTQSLFKQDTLARKKNITLDMAFSDDLPFVWADVDLLERVLQNLLDNAIKFTPHDGTVMITTALRQETNQLLVSIKDSGTGIPEDVHPFQKFSKGDQEEHGSGLGLAFCKLVLDAHGQSIWVADTSSTGTTITFSLAVQSTESDLAPPNPPEDA